MSEKGLAIQVKGAGLKLDGSTIFEAISFDVPYGSIHGIMGRNGTGKTMLLRCVEGFIPLTEGSIHVGGKHIRKACDFAPDTAFVIEPSGFLPQHTGFDNLRFLASISKKIKNHDVEHMIKRLGLDPHDKKTVGKYSKGMLQRLNIAQALMERPRVLLLDEPMNGLDHEGLGLVKGLLLDFAKNGGAVLLTSHYLEDFANLCSRVFEMRNGQQVKVP